MKIIPNYENSVAVIPSRVIDCLNDATGDDMAVLIAVLRDGAGSDSAAVCRELGIDEKTFNGAIAFWEKHGIISVEKENRSSRSLPLGKKNSDTSEKKRNQAASGSPQKTEVPYLTTDEAAKFLEGNEQVRLLIKDIEKNFGKILTRSEICTVIGLIDHLNLSPEYIMLLVAHAKERDKKSVRYVEKLAFDLFDNGITSYSALVEEMNAIETAFSFEGTVRKIFGLGKRSLTKKEKAIIKVWCSDWGYGEDMVTEAYEITVANTNEASLPYANAILEKWNSLDIRTPEQARSYQEEHLSQKKKKSARSVSSSFDTDDFFEAALKRSYDKK